MATDKVHFWNSIVSRFALFFAITLIFTVLLAGFLVYQKSSAVIMEYAEQEIHHASELVEKSFYSHLYEMSNDISLIATSKSMSSFINGGMNFPATDLMTLMEDILQNKPSYFQIRFLDTTGMEIIRLIKSGTKILNVPKTDLQSKADMLYFQEAREVEEGRYYFSRIGLNEDQKEASRSQITTIRGAMTVFNDQRNLEGVLFISMDLSNFFYEMDQISAENPKLYLVDELGQYIYNPDKIKEFGVQKNTGYLFRHDYVLERQYVDMDANRLNKFVDAGGSTYLNKISNITYSNGDQSIYLVAASKESFILEGAKKVGVYSLKTLFLVVLLSLLASFFFTHYFSKRINKITLAISNYANNVANSAPLPTSNSDEIGVLARSFSAMKDKIETSMKDLNRALEEEKEAKKNRDEFLQNMSHELRTPLHAIKGLTQVLRKNNPNKVQLPIIDSLEKSVSNLSGLVYDVLDHQKLVEGKLELQHESISIGELLSDIHSTYQYDAVRKGLTFSKDIPSSLTRKKYFCDPLRLSQIVTNLVVNAIKYTLTGTVSMVASIEDGDNPICVIKIIDTGVGIKEENLHRINDRAYRESERMSGRYGDYGLGLSIVKQLVTLFGGTLEARSIKNQGSQFIVSIPVIPATKGKSSDRSPIRTELPILNSKYKIVYLDDDFAAYQLLSIALQDINVEIQHANSIAEATSFLNQYATDLLISDLILENENSLAFLEKIKNSTNLPLILVTAMEQNAVPFKTDHFLQKPFDVEVILDKIITLLPEKEYDTPNFTQIKTNYDNDATSISKVLLITEGEFRKYIQQLESLLITHDLKTWQSIAHKLIALARTISLEKTSELLKSTEEVPTDACINWLMENLKYISCWIREERR